ncbi:hypothetical protein SALBM135S_02949 [Streptomyces alboniger]
MTGPAPVAGWLPGAPARVGPGRLRGTALSVRRSTCMVPRSRTASRTDRSLGDSPDVCGEQAKARSWPGAYLWRRGNAPRRAVLPPAAGGGWGQDVPAVWGSPRRRCSPTVVGADGGSAPTARRRKRTPVRGPKLRGQLSRGFSELISRSSTAVEGRVAPWGLPMGTCRPLLRSPSLLLPAQGVADAAPDDGFVGHQGAGGQNTPRDRCGRHQAGRGGGLGLGVDHQQVPAAYGVGEQHHLVGVLFGEPAHVDGVPGDGHLARDGGPARGVHSDACDPSPDGVECRGERRKLRFEAAGAGPPGSVELAVESGLGGEGEKRAGTPRRGRAARSAQKVVVMVDLPPGCRSAARFFVIAGNDTRMRAGVRGTPGAFTVHLPCGI